MKIEKSRERAEAWRKTLGFGDVVQGLSKVGGGSLPEESMPTWLLSLLVDNPDQLMKRLRGLETPVIARIEEDQVLLDPRTVLPNQDDLLIRQISHLIS